jgi:hypothetical protein
MLFNLALERMPSPPPRPLAAGDGSQQQNGQQKMDAKEQNAVAENEKREEREREDAVAADQQRANADLHKLYLRFLDALRGTTVKVFLQFCTIFRKILIKFFLKISKINLFLFGNLSNKVANLFFIIFF